MACVDTVVIDDEESIEGMSVENGGVSYEWPGGSYMTGTMTEGEMPAGEMPAGEMPAGEMPAHEMPAGEMPAGEMPAGEMPAGEMPAGNPDPMTPDYALEMLEYVNQFRQTGGRCGDQDLPSVAPLALHPLLNQAALAHAEDMAVNNYFNHTSQDGRSPGDRISATGYLGNGYGENIAAGNASAFATFEQWKNSAGHCENMLRARFNELGVGYYNQAGSQYRNYWVQKFSTR